MKHGRLTGTIVQSEKSRGLGIVFAGINRFLNAFSRYIPMYPLFRVYLQKTRGVHIGNHVFIGSDVLFDEVFPESIIIEDQVTIIARSTILSHAFFPTHFKKTFSEKVGKTILKKGSYIGLGSIILPGITIGQYAAIGAGSVVTKNIPDHSIAYGNPAIIQGYICPCGNKLPAQFTRFTCPSCKTKLRLEKGELINVQKT